VSSAINIVPMISASGLSQRLRCELKDHTH
jgi:hypothetical protein